MSKNELYTDSSGNTYILKNDEKLLSYPMNKQLHLALRFVSSDFGQYFT
jgi:hypothetical protein